jgi:LuxR family maltose regulon positive regulatory protein
MPLTEPHSTSLSGATGKSPPLDGKRFQFLATKLVPPRREGLIERPRLLGMTFQLAGKRLAVVKAPAGFGKTSLAAAWLQQLQQSGNTVAWLTIDTDDDEPAAFLFYVSHALQRACEGVGAAAIDLIRESFLINPRAIVSTLINDLADIDDEVYLFFGGLPLGHQSRDSCDTGVFSQTCSFSLPCGAHHPSRTAFAACVAARSEPAVGARCFGPAI